jgi:hypothetical protein
MRIGLLSVLAAVLVLPSTQARAQQDDGSADVRCLIVGMRVSGMGDAAKQTAGQLLSMYHMGRLDAHTPKLDIEALIIKEAAALSGADFAAEARRCGNSFADRGREIQRMGADISQREQAADKPAEPAR